MKRILTFAVVLLCILAFTGCQTQERAKKEIFNLVEENYNVILETCENKDTETLSAIDGIEKVKIVDGYVIVYCKGAGIAPSSQDYGFYYSPKNLPVAVGCNMDILCYTAGLTSEGDGYQYIDSGYNLFYTERIKDNIYFYSTAY